MTERDKDLDEYLRGDSPLSKAYRAESTEQPPLHLDEAILAQARAEAKRKPSWNRVLAPVALAATVVLGVNLGWNLYQAEPLPEEQVRAERQRPQSPSVAQAPTRPAAESKQELAREAPAAKRETRVEPAAEPEAPSAIGAPPTADALGDSVAPPPAKLESPAAKRAPAPAAAMRSQAMAEGDFQAAPVEKSAQPASGQVEALIDWVSKLEGSQFIVDGQAFTPPQAAVYLRIQWKESEAQVHTVEDFIVKCATRSPATGNPYLLREADGTQRALADALRQRTAETR